MSQSRLMKDGLDIRAVKRIANSLVTIEPQFKQKHFIEQVQSRLETLELKQRVSLIIEVLNQHLPEPFSQTAKILEQIPQHWIEGDASDPLKGFAAWPMIDYIGVYGLAEPDTSLELLKHLTHLFSAEFAIRPFIQQNPQRVLERLSGWCEHSDEHVRRLVSEGTRPRLPWGIQLKEFIDDPDPLFVLLENLIDDKSEYVRRSVANNLNDISKDHPKAVIKFCKQIAAKTDKNRMRLIRHATRTLIKNGEPEVFPLLGYTPAPLIESNRFSLKHKQIKLGDDLVIEVEIRSKSNEPQHVVIDFAIDYLRQNRRHNRKVFKGRDLYLQEQTPVTISKSFSFKPITTRRHYPGRHYIALLVNGVEHHKCPFMVLPSSN